jgi:polar amino acid transport system substrate-binding protein
MPMQLARRAQALGNGDIDLMVGLQQDHIESNEFVYLQPSYEKLNHSFFVLNANLISTVRDLSKLNIAVTINAQYFDDLYLYSELGLVEVSTLKQKIGLLKKGRVDAFIHFRESALPMIKRMGWAEEVVLADYQPNQKTEYFVAVSRSSFLCKQRKKLQEIIKEGIKSGDFIAIRAAHY